jgi:hypothetical protein
MDTQLPTEALIPTHGSDTLAAPDQLRLALRIVQDSIANAIESEEVTSEDTALGSLVDLAEATNLSVPQITGLLTSPDFKALLKALRDAKAELLFNGLGMQAIQKALQSGSPREKLRAVQMVGELCGALKAGRGAVSVNIKIEELIRQDDAERTERRIFDIG